MPRFFHSLTSGSPATLVSNDRSPAKSEAEITTRQSTADSTAEVPMVAIAVCATVFTARTAAALSHFAAFLFIFYPSLKSYTENFLPGVYANSAVSCKSP